MAQSKQQEKRAQNPFRWMEIEAQWRDLDLSENYFDL